MIFRAAELCLQRSEGGEAVKAEVWSKRKARPEELTEAIYCGRVGAGETEQRRSTAARPGTIHRLDELRSLQTGTSAWADKYQDRVVERVTTEAGLDAEPRGPLVRAR